MKEKLFISLILIKTFAWAQISVHAKFSGQAKAGSKGELEVEIQKKSINSFAKYQIEFPDGVSISESDVKGGNFSVEGNKAKVVWVNLPNEEKFSIKLKVLFKENVQFPITLYQKFYYLENSIKKEVDGENIIINGNGNIAAAPNTTPLNNPTISNNENSTEKPSKETPTISTNNENKSNANKESKPSENKPTNTTEYTYKIQVAASATKPDENTYSNLGKVEIIQHKGMYKVMIDKVFTTKEEALQYREQVIQKGYTGAFLVKYQNGQRVN